MNESKHTAFAATPIALVGLIPFFLAYLPIFVGEYGLYVDEFYFVACTDHLAAGYVDQPPLSIWILSLIRSTLGDSLASLRLLPASCGFVVALLTGYLAFRLGAKRWGQVVAALAASLVPALNIYYSYYSMNCLTPLVWLTAVIVLVDLQIRRDPRNWLLFGAIVGLAFLNKHPSAFVLVVFATAFVVRRDQKLVRNKFLLLGIGIALLIASPNLLWMADTDWVTLEFYSQSQNKNIATSPFVAGFQQITTMNPGSLPLLAGVVPYFFGTDTGGRPFRWVLYASATLLVLMVISGQSRPDRVAALYPVLFAAAATGWERLLAFNRRPLLRASIPTLPVLVFLAAAPAILPVFPPAIVEAHAARIGIVPKIEKKEANSSLPQWVADRLGWEQLAEQVSRIYWSLPPDERARTAILGADYAFAGSLIYYQEQYSLPPAYSYHNAFYEWGPPPSDVHTWILVGLPKSTVEETFDSAVFAGTGPCLRCIGPRRSPSIFVAGPPREPIHVVWPRLRKLL